MAQYCPPPTDATSAHHSSTDNAERGSAKLHAVMVPCPLQGHINPLLHFAKALTTHHNFIVTFVNNEHSHKLIQKTRSELATEGNNIRFEWVENGLSPDFDYTNLRPRWVEFLQGCMNMQTPLRDLIQSLNKKSPPVTCIVFGSFFPWAHYAAVELNIPSVFFWTQSVAVFSIYYHTPKLVSNGFFPYNKTPPDADLVSYIPGVPPLHPTDFPDFLHVEDTSHAVFKIIQLQFDTLKECSTVIINSFHELEKEAFEALQAEPLSVLLVGPLLPSSFIKGSITDMAEDCAVDASLVQEERSDCMRWLDKQHKQSVVYISFGTIANPSADDLEGIALGIKVSKQPFLWVIRPTSSFHDVSEILPHNFSEDTKDFGLIIPWAPQLHVLSHPSVGAFLTHCGWNSTLESVSSGVPMIAFPDTSDQATNRKYVVDIWKVGMSLKRKNDGKVDCAEVGRVLSTVLHEEEGREMRRRSGKLRDAASRAIEANQGPSDAAMHKFAQAMRSREHIK